MRSNCLLFVQNRPKRAGAQTSLERIVTSEAILPLNPAVLVASSGWLDSALEEKKISYLVSPWPSPRSLRARLGGLSSFAQQTVQQLAADGIFPSAIVANDHQESLLALALAKAANNIPVISILRTPGMSQRDFEKYGCHHSSAIFARGRQLAERVEQWWGRPVGCMEGSFCDHECYPPKATPNTFPTKILIAGSEEPRKGFTDFIEALAIIEKEQANFPALECVFTGDRPSGEAVEKLLNHPFRSQLVFKGRINKFIDFARDFSLAIHPSRSESFGMAPLELILAGIPTMVSRTGVIDQLHLPNNWCFKPESPEELAERIIDLWKSWPDTGMDIPAQQTKLLANYHISRTTEQIASVVLNSAPPSHELRD